MHPHDQVNDEVRDLASLYALGGMPSAEAESYAGHLLQCAVCRDEVAAFEEVVNGFGLAVSIAPPARLRQRLLERVEGGLQPAKAPPKPTIDFVLRGVESDWKPVPYATGVYSRVLFVHPSTGDETLLVRMDPGGKYPAHPHVGVEQMYILSGELIFEDHTLHAGDFEAATASHAHAAATTKTGCTVLVVHHPLTHA
jgi:anti-sigma factor ChrR (cupin superfamily)